jgi:uncharacterized protein YbbC (DUF1343 family)
VLLDVYRRLTFSALLLCLLFTFQAAAQPLTGADRMDAYLPLLEGRRVALLINQTSVTGGRLLADTLLARGVRLTKIFAPEHGFRGTADAGASVRNDRDSATGLPVISLYGSSKKISKAQLADVDLLIYDLQDVGVRFYTYISTLQYAMEACAAHEKPLLVLDRPNPNGYYVDGPVLDTALRSFVGMQPVPVVYGMTVGEYAQMLRGERWFPGAEKLQLTVIPCEGYRHGDRYPLPVPPSPNLKTADAVRYYPSLCLFEGTVVSVGRGTATPFEHWGHPAFRGKGRHSFTPVSMTGATKPLLEGKTCYGEKMKDEDLKEHSFTLQPLLQAYQWYPEKEKFFSSPGFFDKLAGTPDLRRQIIAGITEQEIRATWQPELNRFKEIRKRYLLYPDFE